MKELNKFLNCEYLVYIEPYLRISHYLASNGMYNNWAYDQYENILIQRGYSRPFASAIAGAFSVQK